MTFEFLYEIHEYIGEKGCIECGHHIKGHMVIRNEKDVYCKSCAADHGMWDKDDVDIERFNRFDEIHLVMDESLEDQKSTPRRRCYDGRVCYCAPFEDEPPRLEFHEVSGWFEYDPDEILYIGSTGPIVRRRDENH